MGSGCFQLPSFQSDLPTMQILPARRHAHSSLPGLKLSSQALLDPGKWQSQKLVFG